jgi:hypothetical protein
MKRLAGFLAFMWDFVVGDDWRIAASVVVVFVVTALLNDAGVSAWWLLPPVVAAMLTVSVLTEFRGVQR